MENEESLQSVTSIVWNNWGIVEVLSNERNSLRSKLIDAVNSALEDEIGPHEPADLNAEEPADVVEQNQESRESIKAEIVRKSNHNGLIVRYFLEQTNLKEDGEVTSKKISLGAISIDIPEANDGALQIEVSAGLPQQRIYNRSLEDSKTHVRDKVEKASIAIGEQDDVVDTVNIGDLDRAIGRNDLAKRIVDSAEYNAKLSEMGNINELVGAVMSVFRVYTLIPQWLAEKS